MLPVSSSAHVTIASKLMHFDRGTKYDWAFLLIMLHTGNMLAVIYYFRARWKSLWKQLPALILATVATGIVGLGLYIAIKRFVLSPGEDIEDLFTRLPLIAAALAAVGIVIIAAWLFDRRTRNHTERVGFVPAMLIGIVQGIALGVSRIFSLWLDDFGGHVLPHRSNSGRGVQLCSLGAAHTRGDYFRSSPFFRSHSCRRERASARS